MTIRNFTAQLSCPDNEFEGVDVSEDVTGWSLVPVEETDGEYGYHVTAKWAEDEEMHEGDSLIVFLPESRLIEMLEEIGERKAQWGHVYPDPLAIVDEEPTTDERVPLSQHAVFTEMNEVESSANDILKTLRRIRRETPTEVLQSYGGKDYPRQLSLGITQLESGLLWLGQVIEEDLEDAS